MFSKKVKERTKLDEAIDAVHEDMKMVDPDQESYAKMLKQLAELYKIRSGQQKDKLSINTLVSVGGSLLGIGMIIVFERNNVVTSKALSFVLKPRA